MSRLGKRPIAIPDKVEISQEAGQVTVKGPKGTLTKQLPPGIAVKVEEGQAHIVTENGEEAGHFMGLARALLAGYVKGATEGHEKVLELVGIGYRASVKGKNLDLLVGLSHPMAPEIPEGLEVVVEENVRIRIRGMDPQLVGQFAAEIRRIRPPEPYKGKGIRYKDERVRRKAGKRKG